MNRHSPFVGRVAELAALEEALAGAILGRGGAVTLAGEPGIGKTRLAGELGDRAQRRGARVLWGRCATDAEAPAYWPFVQVLRPLYGNDDAAALIGRFGPGAADVLALLGREVAVEAPLREAGTAPISDQQRFRLFDAATTMLLAAAADHPLVFIFDDIHAADPGCLQLLVFLARALRSSRVLVVGTLRSVEARRAEVAPILLGTLAREALALSLDGWTIEEVGAFLGRGRGRAGDGTLVDSVHRASAGNPFFVGEIARLIRPGGAAAEAGGSFPVPAHVRQAVLARTGALSAEAAAVLAAAAVVGLSFDARTVAAVAGVDAADAARALDETAEAGFVERGAGASWSFRHEIARDVLYEGVDAATQRRGHLAAAAELARTTRSSEGQAHHLLCALPDGSLETTLGLVLDAAATAAAAMAYERAATWLGRGLTAIGMHGPSEPAPPLRRLHGRLLLALGDARWAAGDLVGSRSAFEDAAALAEDRANGAVSAQGRDNAALIEEARGNAADPPDDAVLLAHAALGVGGRQQRAHVQFDARVVTLLENAIAAVSDREPPLVARLQARLAYALYAAPGSRAEREVLTAEALELARSCDDANTLAAVLGDARWALWGPTSLDERRGIGDELLALAHRRQDREAALVEYGWRIVDGLEVGDRAALDEAFAAYRGRAAELRLPWYEWYATRFACLVAQVEGRLDDAERLAAEALAAGQRAGHPDATLSFASQMLGVRLAQDRIAETEGTLEISVAQYPDVLLWRRLLARVRVAQGREAEAAGEIEHARAGDLVEAPGDFLHLPSLVILAELVTTAADREVCERVFEALAVYSGRQVVLGFGMSYLGPVDQYLGELAAACGRTDEARDRFERASAQTMRLGALRWASRARTSLRSLGQSASRADASSRPSAAVASTPPSPTTRAVLARDGAGWRGEFAGRAFHIGPLRGIVYLRALLEIPERELHVLELAALGDPTSRSRDHGGGAVLSNRADISDTGPMLDDQAKRAYRARLAELKAELDEATDFADSGRMTIARAEIEALEDELARAIGLGGRDRKSGAAAERARVAVAKRIRGALERIGEQSPELQRYLEATVRTGVFCVYRPDPGRPIEWEI